MPPDLSGQPLDELKEWLAITTPGENALLLRLLETGWHVCLQFTGVDAAAWSDLPEALRHGIVRHASHQYRERDDSIVSSPPSAVAALWRPHRMLRL